MKLRSPAWKVSAWRAERTTTVDASPRVASADGMYSLIATWRSQRVVVGEVDDAEAAFADAAGDLEVAEVGAEGQQAAAQIGGYRARPSATRSPDRDDRRFVIRRVTHTHASTATAYRHGDGRCQSREMKKVTFSAGLGYSWPPSAISSQSSSSSI